MKKIAGCLALVLAVTVAWPLSAAMTPPSQSVVGVLTKVILEVVRKELGKDWIPAKRGESLGSGDVVKTGQKSLAIIKFLDNSLIKVRENSELTITGELKGGTFLKDVTLERGVIGFNIQKQKQDEQFRFTSPASVASIRGTGGLFASGAASDTLIVIEGIVNLTNLISTRSLDVTAGFTGISSADGTVDVRPSTAAEKALGEEGARATGRENRLEFELRDSQGNRKKLKIDYNE